MNEPLWKLWRNPIVRRFATSRLRWKALLAWSVILQALAAFLWLSVFFFSRNQWMLDSPDSALRAWVAVLVLQGVLWLMKGTFSVATGIAREGVEGLTEAQILTPLSSWQKTVGYLVGLPILETVLVLSLIPWTVVSIAIAHVPATTVFRVHLLLVTAALVHHALGLVAGTVIRQKIVAGTVSQVIVILLHGIVPLLSKLGLGPLGHLGVGSAIASEIRPLLQKTARQPLDTAAISALSHIRFFGWEFTLTGYQWLIMTLLLGVLLTVLWRRWQRSTAHLLSKPLAVCFFSWIIVLSLGELLPRLQETNFLPSIAGPGAEQMAVESRYGIALIWAGGFGVVGLITAMLLASSIAPTLDQHWQALRGLARSVGARRLPWADDARSAIPWSLALGAVLVAGWTHLVQQLLQVPFLSVFLHSLPAMPWVLGVSIVLPLIVWVLTVEWRGLRFASMAMFVVWIVPLMVAIVSVLSGVSATGWPRWFAGASGFTLPLFALLESVNGPAKMAADVASLHPVWLVSISCHASLAILLFLNLRRAQKPAAESPVLLPELAIEAPATPS